MKQQPPYVFERFESLDCNFSNDEVDLASEWLVPILDRFNAEWKKQKGLNFEDYACALVTHIICLTKELTDKDPDDLLAAVKANLDQIAKDYGVKR